MAAPALAPLIAGPGGAPTDLPTGQWAAALDLDVAGLGSRRGRLRRWSYVAAADDEVAAGAAVVDLGYTVASFLWICRDGQVSQWERKGLPGRHGRVPTTAAGGEAWFRAGRDEVRVGPDGTLHAAVGHHGQRLAVDLAVRPDTPALIVVPTAGGGWNATQKVAGESATGTVTTPAWSHELSGSAWRDYTVGRQDRDTRWRWAAGAGRTDDGRVGINVSTGMNEHAPGENLVWWDGTPYALPLDRLEPVGAFDGAWVLSGEGWSLDFQPDGVRAADENLLIVRSRYVQPIGTFRGSLPGPDGRPRTVTLHGVTEDHRARW
jgi:hypothetical protein